MSDSHLERIKSIVAAVLAADESQRAQLLDRLCAGDADLHREVEQLVRADRPKLLRDPRSRDTWASARRRQRHEAEPRPPEPLPTPHRTDAAR